MNKTQKLNIRINFVTQADKPAKEEIRYIYHWRRIIGAFLLLSIAVTALAGGLFYYLNQTAQPKKENIKAIPLQSPDERTIQIHSAREAPAAKKIAITAESVTTEIPNVPEAVFTPVDTKIFSAHIKRFVISETVADKEPEGTISDIVFDANNIATVYAYSDAVGLKDEILYYNWSLNGQAIAKVKVGVWSNRWRSYSRKFIRPHMHGDWQIALENEKGEILAVNRFRY